ncbi:hypothetical protein LOTGIDRAFT_203856 [Lottia gigantea]|uniref:Serine/threonine-protein phosphatase PGAM5, mitochondrial n=1 Tax=Lottia gigantea TaxID=225164 RepID=V4C1R7_LOTGI|nr:hypothetical protein LOTGIDRAFT_203856 [Lottia gigantea]ESO95389.1 hypothetical protein LOTGIDRAFT_203856 [Lottia gigantea]
MTWRKNPLHFLKQFSKLSAATTAGAITLLSIYVYDKRSSKAGLCASWTNVSEEIPYPKIKWNHNWDRRDPKSLVKPSKNGVVEKDENNNIKNDILDVTPTATRNILLIRHGQYNLNGLTDTDRYLTTLGRTQADLTGSRLKELDLPYTKLISSTMTRALETADIIHKHLPDLPREKNDMLREGAPIPPEPPVGHWKPENYQFYTDGQRIEAAFRHYIHRAPADQTEDSFEIIVCHANVIRYFVCRALQFPPDGWLRLSLAHASITWLTVRPSGRVSLKCYGDSGYMEPKKISYS